jgi:pyruvate dehydrogenase E1 component
MAEGLRRMFAEREDIFYYLTLYNENYAMPAMPAGAEEGIIKGLYKFQPGPEGKRLKAQLLKAMDRNEESVKAYQKLKSLGD